MKTNRLLIAAATLVASAWAFCLLSAQSPTPPPDSVSKEKVAALAQRIEAQQRQIEENQVTIDSKLDQIGKDVQLAYDFSMRAAR